MKRVSLLLRFVLAVSVVCLLSTGLFAEQNDQPNGSTPAAKTTAKKSQKAKASSHGTSSGSSKVEGNQAAALALGMPNPADDLQAYPMTRVDKVAPAVFNGDVRDLPQIASQEHPELDLVEPLDYVHADIPDSLAPKFTALSAPLGPMPALSANFSGMSYLDNYCTGGQCGNGHPPDTNGDVGLHHYIQAINEGYAIYDKATGNRLAAFTEVALWAGAGTTPCTTDPFGDPIVMYDQTADRWILANLGFNLSGGNPVAPYMECVAVSQTGDPVTGGWYLYAFRIDQSPVPTNTLNDYPKFGNWNDGCLYMGANGFANASTFNGGIMAGFTKSQMYAGGSVNWTLAYLSGNANFGYEPATMLGKGSSLPSPSTHEYYVTESSTSNAFGVRTITAGACNAGGTISAATNVAHATYSGVSSNIVPQPPPATTANTLDSLGNRLMQRVQYRNVGGAESVWVNHTTRNSSSSNTSPQWGQINVTGGTVNTSIVQQQIYRPDTTLYRWMGSLGVDNGGNMAMCYSTSNATLPNFPSMQCAGRLATDPVNTLPQGESDFIAGAGSGVFNCGGAVCHRWGDYSSMSVDPTDDCTFWHTNEYYNSQANGTLGNHQTQVIAFKYPSCNPVLPVAAILKSHSGNFTQGQVGATYSITVTNNGPGYMSGTTTVTDALPSPYLVATAIGGSGWSCTLGTLTCTRTDSLAQGSSYPAITVTVNVASNAPAQVTNSATVSGGGTGSPATSNDVTNINAATTVCGTVQLTTTASLVKLGNGSYQATVLIVNNGTGTAQNVKLTAATLGVPSGTPIPQTIGNLVPGGGFAYATVTFPSSAGTSGSSVAEKYTGTYTACPTSGSFGASIRATLP
jgi:uncharacterized repeat protein (TIGR01451 family)